ncbi:MAG: hypothetical protein LQ341_005486 [Variospora aurantia]|nr:MAG: hypothetical protein LQ341_005486 [Variospora aurantia]
MESVQCSAPSLDAIRRAGDISATLRLAHEAILANDRFCQEVEEQCALNIASIWEYIDQRERSEPHHATLIQRWRQQGTQAIKHQTIEHYKTLAAVSQHRIDRYRARIRQAWGVESSQVLEPKHYKQDQGLSQACLQSLAHLSEHVPLEDGRSLILHQIQHRTLSKVTGFRDTDLHLKPRDIKRALAAARVQTAETADSSDHQSSASSTNPSASTAAPQGDSNEPQFLPQPSGPSRRAPRKKRKTNYFYSSKGKVRKLPAIERPVSPSFTHASNGTDVGPDVNLEIKLVDDSVVGPVVDPVVDSEVDTDVDLAATRLGEDEPFTITGECSPDIELARTQTGPNLSAWFPDEPSDLHAMGAEPQSLPEQVCQGTAKVHEFASVDDMPESILQAALDSLAPRKRLTTTTIEWILESFNADRYQFVDPASSKCRNPKSKPPVNSKFDVFSTKFMIPMYHIEQHWTLGTLEAGRADFYDSLRSTMHEKDARKVLGAFYQSRFEGNVPWSLPALELKPCQTPQQGTGVDSGMYVVIAAMYLMANRPLPECFDIDTCRFILRAALDVSFSQSDDRSLEPPSSPRRLEPPDPNVGPRHGVCAEIARREHHQADLRKRVEHLRRASASLAAKIQGLDEMLKTLTILQQQRDGLHIQIRKEQEIHAAECAKIERLIQTIPGYGFAFSQAAIEQGLIGAHGKAISLHDIINLNLGRSAVKQAVVAKAVVVATSLGKSYTERLTGVRRRQQMALDEIVEIDRFEETLRAERGRWMEELQTIP